LKEELKLKTPEQNEKVFHQGLTLAEEPEVTIVIPAYNEEGNLRKLHMELTNILGRIRKRFEIIIVDDGSTDGTWNVITEIYQKDKSVKGIRLSRNFGHQYAVYAGLSHAAGNAVISMDADMQHPPELIPKLIDEWHKGNKIVNTIRIDPNDYTYFKKVTAKLYYRIFSFLSGVRLEPGMSDFRLLDRQVLNTILGFREEGLFLRGIIQWLGYPSFNLPYQCQDRFSGTSKYTLKKMMKLASSGIISFSIIPLRLGIIVGIICSLFAFWQMVDAIYSKVVLHTAVPGWAQTMTVLSFMFGVLFILLGVLGEYLGRVLIEVRRRPRFLVSEFLGIDNRSLIRHEP
jgi:dolichol-phosphate mannosyltransferase